MRVCSGVLQHAVDDKSACRPSPHAILHSLGSLLLPPPQCQVMTFPVNCNDCAAPGETRMCVTDIPHFKEIIIMSFLCDECGNRTVEVKGGGAVPDHGTKTTLRVEPGEETLGWGLGRWG